MDLDKDVDRWQALYVERKERAQEAKCMREFYEVKIGCPKSKLVAELKVSSRSITPNRSS